jgi:hypothetical protein
MCGFLVLASCFWPVTTDHCLPPVAPCLPLPLGYNAAMVLRWLIRGVCLALLAGVVGVWAGSYAGWLHIHKFTAGRDWGVGAVQGLGFMIRSDYVGLPTEPLEFIFERRWTAKSILLPPRSLGFYGGRWPREPDSWLIIFPLWLPALLLVVLNGLVWRWTRRRKVGVGVRGFPIEPAKKADV